MPGMKEKLEVLYRKYNRRRYAEQDPVKFLYNYEDMRDREIAALTASSLAYGRVAQILASVSAVLEIMGPFPARFLAEHSSVSLRKSLKGFRHRFAKETHLAHMLEGAKEMMQEEGSLYQCFLSGMKKEEEKLLPALERFCTRIRGKREPGHLIPYPEKGSACKRMHLFLRWMVRKDRVDPGGWEKISPSALTVPLDVHMHRMGIHLGLTARKQADIRTALEITAGFARWVPEDPVRYDFALTRPGIRGENTPDLF